MTETITASELIKRWKDWKPGKTLKERVEITSLCISQGDQNALEVLTELVQLGLDALSRSREVTEKLCQDAGDFDANSIGSPASFSDNTNSCGAV